MTSGEFVKLKEMRGTDLGWEMVKVGLDYDTAYKVIKSHKDDSLTIEGFEGTFPGKAFAPYMSIKSKIQKRMDVLNGYLDDYDNQGSWKKWGDELEGLEWVMYLIDKGYK
jgi:hypothetical protein